jgi:hypothetical protein
MPLLLIERSPCDRRKNEDRTRIAAAEACCVHQQTSNGEGRPQDLQIRAGKFARQCALNRKLATPKIHPAAVDIQDNLASIWHHCEPLPELK